MEGPRKALEVLRKIYKPSRQATIRRMRAEKKILMVREKLEDARATRRKINTKNMETLTRKLSAELRDAREEETKMKKREQYIIWGHVVAMGVYLFAFEYSKSTELQ
jgi:hypothetical protein